jgi:hypothetical protein
MHTNDARETPPMLTTTETIVARIALLRAHGALVGRLMQEDDPGTRAALGAALDTLEAEIDGLPDDAA